MPKPRQTCTRCSMRRQKCDRKNPCSRCVHNKESHLCTRQWPDGYDPNIHRKYPKKKLIVPQDSAFSSSTPITDLSGPCLHQTSHPTWPDTPISARELPNHIQSQDPNPTSDLRAAGHQSSYPTNSSSLDAVRPTSQHGPSTSIDFITFGRSDFSDISISTLLTNKDPHIRNKVPMNQGLDQTQNRRLDDTPISTGAFSAPARSVEIYHLQSILPAKSQVFLMVDYHERFMLYWSGGIYHAPSFRRSLHEAYGQSHTLELQNLDWRWTALLFSILSASIIGSPDSVSVGWGYPGSEKVRLTRQWGHATISCLLLGDFASKYHIYSVQAIINMHTSEHLVGSSKEFVVYQGAALVIAKGLGLHRLGPHPDDGSPVELPPEQKKAFIQREIGRRVWYALTSQDWLCSSSTGMYNIQKRHFTTIKPGYYDEETMTPVSDGTPTFAHSANYLNEIAELMIEFHDDILDAPDITSKYSVVLKHDAKIRALCAERIPSCFSPRTLFNPSWPRWVAWSRRLHQVSCAHKIIMYHQSFLGRSFKNQQFTYSRWACATSARTIIELMSQMREEDEPQWWVEQAFVVTAGITLALDLFHRLEKEPEAQEYKMSVDKTIELLQLWPNSSLAAHGIRLLTSLLHERSKRIETTRLNPPPSATTASFLNNISLAAIAHAASDSTRAEESVTEVDANQGDGWMPDTQDVDTVDFEQFMDTFPLEACLDNVFFENMLSLAHSEFL
ncbi:hypothetical protein K469DRAFT_694358 [Zopfia rhizophila CBS 207.26]|uniref:Zn(2)-C6 fungal-type domain-containing protein n=1 Tax=Zopfia rhizophila CBS 207.26 TaxID=1314779 RepID=A0A6A6EQN8_9PEZI|nr:hypothetical protein K469DRAFT_694358 [Zopfia rhizophila CBS 207.26]